MNLDIQALTPVLSLDTEKVRLVTIDNRMVVKKQTPKKEYEQIVRADGYLHDHLTEISEQGLIVNVAPIIGWGWSGEKSFLTTVYCQGINGEVALREVTSSQRPIWIRLFRQFLLAMRDNGFLWGDCAPRNTIIDIEKKCLWLVDFERNLQLAGGPVEKQRFSRHIRSYAQEEFSCFLFYDEQRSFFSGIIIEEDDDDNELFILLSKVGSKRKASLLAMRFGRKEAYSSKELRQTEDMMAIIATPFKINGHVLFPMYTIDRITNKKGAETYASIATLLYKARSLKEKSELLESMAATI